MTHVGTLTDEDRSPLTAELIIAHVEKLMQPEKNLQVGSHTFSHTFSHTHTFSHLPQPSHAFSQVLVQAMEVFNAVAASFAAIARRSASKGLRCAVERLGTKQTKPAAGEAMLAMSEACGPAWVLNATREAALAHKNPKV